MATKKAAARPAKRTPRRSVLSDEIYDMIKAMIFDHEIAPGSRVNIDALALQLEVSQTPVREALARLESDGLIEKEPLKGGGDSECAHRNRRQSDFRRCSRLACGIESRVRPTLGSVHHRQISTLS